VYLLHVAFGAQLINVIHFIAVCSLAALFSRLAAKQKRGNGELYVLLTFHLYFLTISDRPIISKSIRPIFAIFSGLVERTGRGTELSSKCEQCHVCS